MARKLVPLDEAAKQLSLSPDELNEMRQNGEIYGYRDGASWKFKPEDIEKLAEERAARGTAGVSDSGPLPSDSLLNDSLPSDSTDDGDDMVLLSEVELGASASTSSTVIGKPGKGQAPEDSDIKLAIDSLKQEAAKQREAAAAAHHDSDVLPVDLDDDLPVSLGSQLDLSNPAAHPDSATQLQVGGPGSDLALGGGSDVILGGPGSDVTLSLGTDSGKGLGGPGSDLTLGGGSDVSLGGPGSDLTLGGPGSDLTLDDKEDDVFKLQDAPGGSSKVRLGEEASVLDSPGSGAGSDITISPGDSGISLLDPSDSGLSLEQPLELSSADDESSFDLSSDSSGTLGDSSDFDSDAVMELKGEDDFLLTPLEEAGDDESQDSGSQVIALDSDTGDFDDAAPTMLGDAEPAGAGLLEADDASGFGALGTAPAGLSPSLGVGPGMVMAPASAESPYGILAMTMLSLGTVVLAFTGMMMFDVVRNMWSWDSPYASNSFLMDNILSLFEG